MSTCRQNVVLLKEGFATYRSNGEMKLVAIGAISGFDARVEILGKWRVENGQLLEVATEAPSPAIIEKTHKSSFVSVEPNRIVLHDDKGNLEMRRGRVPTNLPPLSKWMNAMFKSAELRKAFAVKTPQPTYPYAARRDLREGRGVFRLLVGPAGDVQSVTPLQTTGDSRLDEAAISALKEWRFVPGKVRELVEPVIFTMHPLKLE